MDSATGTSELLGTAAAIRASGEVSPSYDWEAPWECVDAWEDWRRMSNPLSIPPVAPKVLYA